MVGELGLYAFHHLLVHASFQSFLIGFSAALCGCVQRRGFQLQTLKFLLHSRQLCDACPRNSGAYPVAEDGHAQPRPLGKYIHIALFVALGHIGFCGNLHRSLPTDLFHQFGAIKLKQPPLRLEPCMTIPLHKGKVPFVLGQRAHDALCRPVHEGVVFLPRLRVAALLHIVAVSHLPPHIGHQNGLSHKGLVVFREVLVIPLVAVLTLS